VAKFNPDVLAQWIERDCLQPNFQALRDLLVSCVRHRISKYSDEPVAELAEEMSPSVSLALERRKAEYIQDAVNPPFEVSVEDEDFYYKALPRPEVGLLNQLRICSPRAFEVFCKMILSGLKADAVVEGGPHDGGIDFYAIGFSPGAQVNPAPPTSKTVVIGQSKRYSATNDVGEVDLRSFIGGTVRKAEELRRKHPDGFGLLTPVLLAFWTTGDFTPQARQYARDLGIWHLNDIALAQLATRIGLTVTDIRKAESEAAQVHRLEPS